MSDFGAVIIALSIAFGSAFICQAITHAGNLNNDRLMEIHGALLPLNRIQP